MLHLSSSGAAKLLSGDDTENENDELNGEDIDTTWRLVFFFYFLPLFSVKQSVVIGRFFEASGDTNSGIDGGVTLGGGKKLEVEEVVDIEESAAHLVLVVNAQ